MVSQLEHVSEYATKNIVSKQQRASGQRKEYTSIQKIAQRVNNRF